METHRHSGRKEVIRDTQEDAMRDTLSLRE